MGALSWRKNRDISKILKSGVPEAPSTRAIWSDLGCRAAEFLVADRFLDEVVLASGSRERYERVRALGQGVLVATAHLGHWELMAAALAHQGVPVTSIAARPKPGPLGELLLEHRTSLGITTLSPGYGARESVRRLKQGETVGLFVDQATAEKSRSIPFLGRDAPTPLTFERLLELSGAVPLFIWNHRNELGQYVIHVENVPTEDSLRWLTQRLETLVRTYPEQWVWLHRRWTHRGARIQELDEVRSSV